MQYDLFTTDPVQSLHYEGYTTYKGFGNYFCDDC